MAPYIGKRLLRRPWLSGLSLVLSGVLAFLLCFLSGYRQQQELRLQETRESFEIECVVTDLRGSKSSGLLLDGEYADFVLAEEGLAPYIRDLRLVKEFRYSYEPPTENTAGYDLLGVNCEAAIPAGAPGQESACVLLREDFFERDEDWVLVPERLYRELEGETLTVYVMDPAAYRPQYGGKKGLGEISFTVVGWVPGGGETLYCSYSTARRLMDSLSGKQTVDAISFHAAHNDELDALQRAAGRKFSRVQPNATSRISSIKPALTVYDEQYRATLAALEQNIARTGRLLPAIALLSLGAGFLICFLATRGEGKSYALMRTLGMTQGRMLGSVMLEQLLIPLLISAAVGAALGRPGPAAVSLGFHALGALAAAVKHVCVSPNAILRSQE